MRRLLSALALSAMLAASLAGPASAAPFTERTGLSTYEQNPHTDQTSGPDSNGVVVVVNIPGDASPSGNEYGQDNPDNSGPEDRCGCAPLVTTES